MVQFAVGQTFAGYTLDGILGRGGMGCVYLARHPRLPRQVALKLLAPEVSLDEELRRRFEQEANAIARLDHPNIVGILDRGVHDGHLWIAMQYVEGSDASRLNPRDLSVERALRIISETAAALDYAHSRGILHRDVKPANILLSRADTGRDERAILTDFGIARLLDSNTQLTSTGTFTATLAYASPEQLSGERVDHRSDQYSLACTLFALLAGQSPFAATNPGQVVAGHLSKSVPALSEYRTDVSRLLDEVVARAASKIPANRFVSCSEFASEAIAASVPRSVPSSRIAQTIVVSTQAPAQPWTPPKSVVPPAGRQISVEPRKSGLTRRKLLGFGAAAVSASALGIGGVAALRHKQPQAGNDAGVALGNLTEIRNLAFSPDGAILAAAAAGPPTGGLVQLWDVRTRTQTGSIALRSVADGLGFSPDGGRLVTGTLVPPAVGFWNSRSGQSLADVFLPYVRLPDSVAFNPDRSLAVFADGGSLSFWDMQSRQQSGEPISTDELVKLIAFSQDGSTIALAERRRMGNSIRVRVFDVQSRQLICAPMELDQDATCLVFSPDGRTLALGRDLKGVQLWNMPAGQSAGELNPGAMISVLAFSPDGRTVATASGHSDGQITLWDLSSRSRLSTFSYGDTNQLTTLAFSPDGSQLVSGGRQQGLRLWDTSHLR